MTNIIKSTAIGSYKEIAIDQDFYLLKFINKTADFEQFEREVDKNFLQLHFCLRGQGNFIFNNGGYVLPIQEETSLLLYNPQRELPVKLNLSPNSWIISIVMTIKEFHSLFSEDAAHIHFISEENKDKKYYADAAITPVMAVVLSQIMNNNLNPSIEKLYLKGKIYELIGLYFNTGNDADVAQCPFLADEENVRKIRQAKEIILQRMAEPPTLTELSKEINLSLKKLKEGFKQLYGDTVYGFLLDHKMEVARKMLESGQHNVNEVGLKIGYSTSSHFIAAFKKKFGTTPKKYLMSLSS